MNNSKKMTCTPRMSDGRHFTDYRNNSEINSLIITQNNIKDSYEYKNFLTKNGTSLRRLLRDFYGDKTHYNSQQYFHPDPNNVL